MASELSGEEIEALYGPGSEKRARRATRADTRPRDFREPKRLSAAQLDELKAQFRRALPVWERGLQQVFLRSYKLDLHELSEIGCEGLFDRMEPPFCLLRFRAKTTRPQSAGNSRAEPSAKNTSRGDTGQGELGWIAWTNAAALAAIESILGSPPEEAALPRVLSSVESTILARLLGVVATCAAAVLGLEISELAVVKDRDGIGSWRDAGPNADPARLHAQVGFGGPGEPSEFHVYLPGVRARSEHPRDAGEGSPLPAHLGGVHVELSARFATAGVPLGELQSLEVGDVIPLDCTADDPVRLFAGDKPFALGSLGCKNGTLALLLGELCSRDADE